MKNPCFKVNEAEKMLEQISACLEDISNTQLNARRVRDNPPFSICSWIYANKMQKKRGLDTFQFFIAQLKREIEGRRKTGRKGINIR